MDISPPLHSPNPTSSPWNHTFNKKIDEVMRMLGKSSTRLRFLPVFCHKFYFFTGDRGLDHPWHLWHTRYIGPWIPQCHPKHSMCTKTWLSNIRAHGEKSTCLHFSQTCSVANFSINLFVTQPTTLRNISVYSRLHLAAVISNILPQHASNNPPFLV